MKKLISGCFATLLCLYSNAQQCSKVEAYSKVQKAPEWYLEQEKAWTEYIVQHPADAAAWYNLYYAKRLLNKFNPKDIRSPEQKKKDMEGFYKELEAHIPNTYESNLTKWMIGGLDMNNISYLMKANELGPDRTEHLDAMVNISELKGHIQDRLKYSKRQFDAGLISPGMLHYNYNLLIGLDSNALLITIGDNDTYPAWVLQSLGIRKDVHIMNISLLLDDSYRNRLFDELGIKHINVDWAKDGELTESKFQEEVLSLIAHNSKSFPFYISLTAANLISEAKPSIEDKMYLIGLAYKYEPNLFDNMAILQRNFEQLYALDYLKLQFSKDISEELVARINNNYVVPMLQLYQHYKGAGEQQKQARIKQYILALALEEEELNLVKKQL